MASLDYIFQGAPTLGSGSGAIPQPGTRLAPTVGLDSLNGVGYLNAGAGWVPQAPALLAKIDATAQAAAIATAALYTVPSHMGGVYRVSYTAVVTTAATTSSILGGTKGFQLTYTDIDSNTSLITPTAQAASAGTNQGSGQATNQFNTVNTTVVNGAVTANAKGGVAMTYSFDYTSVGGTPMAFAIHVRVELISLT